MKQKPIVQLIPLLTLVALCIAIISLGSSLSSTTRRRGILETRQQELTRLQEKNEELEQRLQIAQSPEFIEREAREKLNLSKPGETIILIDQAPTMDENIRSLDTNIPHWKQWWNLFF